MSTTDCTPHLLLISCQLLMYCIFLFLLQKKINFTWKSQIYRMDQVRWGHRGSSDPSSLLKQVHPRAHSTGLCPDGSWIPPVREDPQPLFPCSVTCTVKMFLLMFRWNFLSFRFCPLPLVPLLATPRRAWCILLTPFHQRLIKIHEVPSQSYFSDIEQAQLPQLSL